ncbi:MAG: HEAT repeat domain-containing protein [Deltaproteobacteria bacterium]|nr:HEAT repeat domain-containing protein [Deltaproteobacteria bacterium]
MNEAVEILSDLRRGDSEQKLRAIKQAGRFAFDRSYFPEAIPLLIELLEQEASPKIAAEAAWALWKFKDQRAIPVLLKKAKESCHPSVREKSIRSLGLLEAAEALPFIKEMALSSKTELVLKISAIQALGHFKEPQVVSILEKLLKSTEVSIRLEALCAIQRFLRRDPTLLTQASLKIIRNYACWKKEKSERVRVEALIAFSYAFDSKKRGVIERAALKDPGALVRKTAITLLSQWRDGYTEKMWLNALEDLSWAVRFEAGSMLMQIPQEKVFDAEKVRLALRKISKIFPSHIRSRPALK